MSNPFDYAPLADLGLPFAEAALYRAVMDDAQPIIMGESPYVNAQTAGISLALDRKAKVRAIFLYRQGVEDFAQFSGSLPAGLTFESNRAEVRSLFGTPAMSAEAGGIGLMAIDFGFDRFEDEARSIRFEYLPDDGGLRLVTLGLD
jgi:hypothetical protein